MAFVRIDDLEERIPLDYQDEKISELGTTLAVTTN
jgi:hypothetical protein